MLHWYRRRLPCRPGFRRERSGAASRHWWLTLYRVAWAFDPFIVRVCVMRPNENKVSHHWRERASLGVEGWKSSQRWSVRRSAVRSIAWLPVADSQTKCNTDDVWRERKKKGLEGEEEWREDGDEVSATERGRTQRAGGVAPGGMEASGDCAGAGAPSEHGLAGTQTQGGALRRLVSSQALSLIH